jgi:competence protein ComEC
VAATAAAWLWWGCLSQQAVRPAGVQCTVLAVGHGACVVIRGPAGGVAMFDAGRLGGGAAAARTAVAALRQLGLRHVDHLLISHEDVDHFNAVPQLLEEIQVGAVWMGPRMLPGTPSHPPSNQPSDPPQPLPAEVARLKAAIADSPARLGHVFAGQTIQLDSRCRLHVLHPPAQWSGSADNADSLVVRIEHAGHSLLLTGDIEGPGLERLFRLAPPSDVLLAPHHGSPLSRPRQLAAQTAARWLIVSAGDPRVAPSVPGCQVFNTARDGAVRVLIERSGVQVQSWRADPW